MLIEQNVLVIMNMKLTEIKKGNIGTGLLIENDGYLTFKNHGSIVKEGIGGDGWNVPNPFIVDCVFQKFGIKNANGRIYPENVLKREVEKYQELIRERRAIGECNHPTESVIDLSRVSHNIVELHWEGRTLVGKIELNTSEGFRQQGIVTTCGDQVANLLLNGYKIGVSSRGVGSVEQKLGQYIVGDDFELICWDVVSSPSTNNAWITTNGEEALRPYLESDSSKEEKPIINEKINKIKEILKS